MFSIVGMIVSVTILIALAVFAYYLVYAKHINKTVRDGVTDRRKMIDIPKIIMIAVIMLLAACSVILSISLHQSRQNADTDNRDNWVSVDLSTYTYLAYSGTKTNDDASYCRIYSKEENPGYTKDVQKQGDFTFTVFTRSGDYDEFHPDFLCFVDYSGKESAELSMYDKLKFTSLTNHDLYSALGSGGGEIAENILYIGNINDNEAVTISVVLLDEAKESEYSAAEQKAYEEDKGEFPDIMDYAVSGGSVEITLE